MKLDDETRKRLIASIRRYADEELEIEIGDLKAGFFLDYCLEEIGPSIYNQAIKDSQAFLFTKLEDLGDTCYEPELDYWSRKGKTTHE